MADLVTVSTGDVITASRANDVKTYIHDGTHLVNTLSLNIGGVEVIDSSRNITTNIGTVDGIDIGTDVAANTAKATNITTNLSEGTSTVTTVNVNSSDGTNATLVSASTTRAGVLTKAKFDEIIVNNAKVTYPGADSTKVGYLTVTQAVDLDTMESNITTNNAKITYPGSANATELNILDGATLTTTELNYVDGVTSAIQTQLDAKQTKTTSSAGVPSTTPAYIGAIYVDTTNLKIYISTGTANSADWKKVLSQ